MRFILTTFSCFAISVSLATAQNIENETLKISVIDVEGGEATLFVTPAGESLLFDTGWPGFNGRDAERIAKVAKENGVSQIDYLVVTHFHTDHMGGANQLASKLPIRTFIDHGVTIDQGKRPRAAFNTYADLRSNSSHLMVEPGHLLPLKGLEVTILSSNGKVLDAPLPDAGSKNSHCESFTFHGEQITDRYGDAEDQRSISALVTFGRFRAVIMGDLTWNKEYPLMCPYNKIGTVDLYLVSHHGSHTSGSRALVHAINPRVAIMNNGPRKGGAVQTFEILRAMNNLEHLWQNHYSLEASYAHNAPNQFIANLQYDVPLPDGEDIHLGPAHWIQVSASADGSFSVTNTRNRFKRSYESTE